MLTRQRPSRGCYTRPVQRPHFPVYGHVDPRELPAYILPEISHYLRIPRATLRSWISGRHYPTRIGRRFFRPVILVPDRKGSQLSFVNLVEAHVLGALRREHQISLDKVRGAINYLSRELGSKHPLAEYRFQTDGLDLFIEKYGQLINVSRAGQMAMREILTAYLQRIDWDATGAPIRLYPYTTPQHLSAPKIVVMDSRIAFGRPVLAGTGIPTAIVAERYKAGESIEQLAADYSRDRLEIEEAIRCELQLEAA